MTALPISHSDASAAEPPAALRVSAATAAAVTGRPVVAAPAAVAPVGDASSVEFHRSYDRDAIERFLREADEARSRLIEDIAASRARIAVAERARREAEEATTRSVGDLVIAAEDELAAMEREHRQRIEEIHAKADAVAAEVLEAARAKARAARVAVATATSSSLAASMLHVEPAAAPPATTAPADTDSVGAEEAEVPVALDDADTVIDLRARRLVGVIGDDDVHDVGVPVSSNGSANGPAVAFVPLDASEGNGGD